jgi:hypothetical protein
MSIGDNFPFAAPTLGSTDWANLIDVIDELITRVSSPVPLSSLEGGDLDLDGNSIINVKAINFQEQTAVPAATPGKMYFYGDEHWLVTTAGAIQVTDNGSLNVATTNGIAGDYGGVNPASLRFVDLTNRYDFYDNYGALEWAYVRGLGFDIAAGLASTLRCRLLYGGAGNLDITLPATIPAANRGLLQVDSSGNITFNDTGVDLDEDVWLGSGEIKHTRERRISGRLPYTVGHVQSGTFSAGSLALGIGTLCTGSGTILFPLNGIEVGWRIKRVNFYLVRTDAVNNTTGTITKLTASPSYGGAVSNSASSNSAPASPNTVSISVVIGAPVATAAAEVYQLQVACRTGDDLLGYEVYYDVP